MAAEDEIEICLGLINSSNANWRYDVRKGRFPLDEFRAKRLFLLSHELSAGTNDGSIQFEQWKVDSRDKIHLVENGRKDLLFGDEEGELSTAAEHEPAAVVLLKQWERAIQSEDALRDFAQYNGHQELTLTISRVNDLLSQIKLSRPQQQTQIKGYFLAV